MNDKLLRPKEAAEFFGTSVSTIWEWSKKHKDFPKKVKISPKVVGWWMSELKEWASKRQAI